MRELHPGTQWMLDKLDWDLALQAGKARYEWNRGCGSVDHAASHLGKGEQEAIAHDQHSVGAEIAMKRLLQLPIVPAELVTKKWVGSIDFTLDDGRRGDTKNTGYWKGRLLVPMRVHDHPNYVELFTLVTGALPRFIYRGWILYGEIVRPENMQMDLKRPCYGLEQTQLHQILYY